MGVLYYVMYAPRRIRKPRLTSYRLNQGKYEEIDGNPIWMPEVGLGIGMQPGTYQEITREWLYWYDREGSRYPTPEEVAQQERQAKIQAQQQAEIERIARIQADLRAEQLAAQLKALGIDPEA